MVECCRKRDKGTEDGTGRKIIKSGFSNRLCDDCLEFESYVWSITAHVIYKLDAKLLKAIFSWETSDIRPLCELDRFEWVIL